MVEFSQSLKNALEDLKQNETDTANAIRTKKGYTSTQKINPQAFAAEIAGIETNPTLQAKTVAPSTDSQIVRPDNGFDGLSQVIVTPVRLQAKSVIPKANGQTVTYDSTYNGLRNVTITGDSNLVADNIKKGVSIFNVVGTFAGGVTGHTDGISITLMPDEVFGVAEYVGESTNEMFFAVCNLYETSGGQVDVNIFMSDGSTITLNDAPDGTFCIVSGISNNFGTAVLWGTSLAMESRSSGHISEIELTSRNSSTALEVTFVIAGRMY